MKILSDIYEYKNRLASELQNGKRVENPIVLYDVYRSLAKVIKKCHLVAVHYLTIDIEDIDTYFRTPMDKWRFFLNKDFGKRGSGDNNNINLPCHR